MKNNFVKSKWNLTFATCEEYIFENVCMLLTGIEICSIITEAKTYAKEEA